MKLANHLHLTAYKCVEPVILTHIVWNMCLRSSICLHDNFNCTCHALHGILCCTVHKDLQFLFTAQCIRRRNITCQSSFSLIKPERAIISIAGLGNVPVRGLQDLSLVSFANVMHFKCTDKQSVLQCQS